MPFAPSRSLTLFIPHLLWPEPAQDFVVADLDLPALQALLTDAIWTRQTAVATEMALAALIPTGGRSLATLRRQGEEDGQTDGDWLCADPAHLRFQQERIVLADASHLDLTAAEAAALVADLNRTFADLGEFSAPHPQRWYLRQQKSIAGALPPLSNAAGRTLAASLPHDAATATFRQLLNELQMFLHAHPLNTSREAAGRPALNALWLWGGAAVADAAGSADFTSMHGDDALSRGLARQARIAWQALAPDLPGLLQAAEKEQNANSHALVHLAGLQSPALYEEANAWRLTLQRFENDWFAPLAAALAAGQLQDATLLAPCAHGLWRWQIKPPSRWQKLRRSLSRSQARPLADWTKDLA